MNSEAETIPTLLPQKLLKVLSGAYERHKAPGIINISIHIMSIITSE